MPFHSSPVEALPQGVVEIRPRTPRMSRLFDTRGEKACMMGKRARGYMVWEERGERKTRKTARLPDDPWSAN